MALAMGGCQKDELSPQHPAGGAEALASHEAMGQTEAALMAQFNSLPSGYEAFLNNLPKYYVRGTSLPEGDELKLICPPPPRMAQGDQIEWLGRTVKGSHIMELPLDKWGPREHAMAKAMEAAYGGGSDAGPMSTGELLDDVMKKIEDNSIALPDCGGGSNGGGNSGGNVHIPSPSEPNTIGLHVVMNPWSMNGDIYVKHGRSSKGASSCSLPSNLEYTPNENVIDAVIPGRWKHSAMMDTMSREKYGRNGCLLSASDRTDAYEGDERTIYDGPIVIGRVGYDKFDGYWDEAEEIGVYRVSNASQEQRDQAVLYARSYKRIPYSFTTLRCTGLRFYCSKLVWRGWYSQGYDLEPREDSFTGFPWIPILVFWRWNYERVLFFRIWYPEFRLYWLRDIWVTPTDLTKTRDTHLIKCYHQ